MSLYVGGVQVMEQERTINELEREITRLRAALAVFANRSNWAELLYEDRGRRVEWSPGFTQDNAAYPWRIAHDALNPPGEP